MGSAISSSAAAAAESLADDTLLENDASATAAAVATDNDEEASPPLADIVEAAAAKANATRRTSRKSQATDFYAPCERINYETGQSKEKENNATKTKAEANQKELNDKWENHRQELIEYKKNHNTYFVSMESNKKLARWADNQRQFHRRGEMNEKRQRLLQEIGFFDEKKPQKSPVKPKLWEENRLALIAYKEKHDTFFVSQQKDKRLSRWAENQRQCHRRGEMNQERQQLLQEIGFFDEKGKKSPQKQAAWKNRLDEIWEENRQALIANKMEHNGSFSFHPKSKLGRWLENQRRAKKLGKLSEKRATLLNEIDIDNDQVYERREEAIRKAADATWEKTRQELIEYKRVHGNYNVTPKSRLGRWIENQRRAFKLYDMPAERAELMHQMGLFPARPEDMVDGRTTPRQKKRKKEEEDGGGSASPARKKRSTAAVRINYNEDDL
eukprot:CAMPEP_0201705842 /NCGR_PEP_ID=MMETSP0578-20130828/47043_1 /ASSEMBLY_ACC=CAM_ASM_000663 /TAXON_ID=267565 /ORGANISM="Skeletonema grethea, Strain CCMP 1804" /LENGTH=441 /DNA_ID=CAMNT_0048194161 /DNA_START=109 /DNA_END=1431 /DNA_ORIENTATION=+